MSLRLRLFLSYAAIVVVTFALVALGVLVLLRAYADRLTLERLGEVTRPIYVHVTTLVQSGAPSAQVWASLQQQADSSDVYLVALSSTGSPVQEVTPAGAPVLHLPADAFAGTQGSFRSGGTAYLWVSYTLGPNAVPALGAARIVALLPRPPVLTAATRLMRPLALAGGLALLVSLLVAFLLARSLYRPLGKLAQAARRVAAGDYTQQVEADGPPEVAQLAQDFNHMTQEVAASQLRLRQFVADTSHELRSPLTSIQGFAQALLDGTAADEATRAKAAEIINVEAGRLKRQVDELLELSRMQAGQVKMAREPVEIGEVLGRAAEVFAVQAQEKQIALQVAAPPGLLVTGDADRLEQVWGNLLDNAIKNSPPGKSVRVQAERRDGWVRVTVADSGPGIPPEHLAHVFARFYQVPGVRTGVGLGLAIAQEIVTRHGGHITVGSAPGAGAQFTVELPAR